MKEYDKELLRSLVKQGLTNRKIAEKMGLTQTQVQYRITADGLVGIRRRQVETQHRESRGNQSQNPKKNQKARTVTEKNARPVNGVQDIPPASVITEHSTNFPEVITALLIIAPSTKKESQ